MSTHTDLVVVYTPVGGGHKAAALAVAEAARARGLSVELIDLFEHAPRVVGDSYVGAHLAGQRAVPNFYGAAFFAANHRDGLFEPVRRGFDHVAFARVIERVRALRPRAVVATHHLPLVVLGRARRKGLLDAPLIGVVTDYIAHACWAEKGVDAWCVPNLRAARDLERHGVKRDRIAITGIPVRPAFDAIETAKDPLPSEPLRVLVTSGGFGVGPIRRVVRSFAYMDGVELTVVCGKSRALARRVAKDCIRFGIDAEIVGFERDMPSRLANAHIVVGKAGGLTVSETMTAGRAMIVVGAVPGNEAINEEMVVRAGAGYASHPQHVGVLADWMRRTFAIAKMGRRARANVVPRAASRVVDQATARASREARGESDAA
jgi:processive 1,2-diacylglycerol beta-glucosyltransferase